MDNTLNYRRSSILSGARRTTFFQRTGAKGIDVIVLTALFYLGSSLSIYLGAAIATGLAATMDALGQGQSIGKRMMGLQVVEEPNLEPCSMHCSLLRNLPLVLTFALTPFPAIWSLSLFLILPVLLVEFYLLMNVDTGVRLGDVIGNTLVQEFDDSER